MPSINNLSYHPSFQEEYEYYFGLEYANKFPPNHGLCPQTNFLDELASLNLMINIHSLMALTHWLTEWKLKVLIPTVLSIEIKIKILIEVRIEIKTDIETEYTE